MLIYYTIGLLLLCACVFYQHYREPLDGSPTEYTQGQAGEIQQLHDSIQKITLTDALVNALQSDNDQMTDQINQLQTNVSSKPGYQ
jgi:hypothetical protein